MVTDSGEQPGRGIAETLAGILAPAAGATAAVGSGKLAFTPLGGPAQLARRARGDFPGEYVFERSALRIPQPQPGEMEQFVYENSIEVAAGAHERGFEQNLPPAEQRAGVDRAVAAEIGDKADSDGSAGAGGKLPEDAPGAGRQARVTILKHEQADSVSNLEGHCAT